MTLALSANYTLGMAPEILTLLTPFAGFVSLQIDRGALKVDMSRALVCFAYARVGKGAWKLDF